MEPKPGQNGWETVRVEPLTADQAAEAAQVGLRLVGEFRPLFEGLPGSARSGLGLARHLSIDRGTATRFVSVHSKPMGGLEVIRQLPGVKGLRQILEGMHRTGAPPETVKTAGAAVDRFERLIRDFAGSHIKLIERLEAARSENASESPEAHDHVEGERRRKLFEAASGALGQRMDLWTVCQVYRPTPGRDGLMDQAMLRGTFGYRARADAPPYALRSFGRNDGPEMGGEGAPGGRAYEPLEGTGVEGVPEATIFREFSSDPPPLVTNRGRGREAVAVIDAERISEDRGLDLVVAHVLPANWRLPILDTPATHDTSVYVGTPCARMIFDVFLHRAMARQCLASMHLYRTTPGIFNNPSSHWYDQLPYPPTLQLVQTGGSGWGSRLHARHAPVLSAFFARLGWAPEEFVGYRIEVEHPYWCGFYSMLFDYRATRSGDAPD